MSRGFEIEQLTAPDAPEESTQMGTCKRSVVTTSRTTLKNGGLFCVISDGITVLRHASQTNVIAIDSKTFLPSGPVRAIILL